MTDIDDLEAKARAAQDADAPDWFAEGYFAGRGDADPADDAFIAAASPDRILVLCERVTRLEKVRDWIERSHANFPGHDHHCNAEKLVTEDVGLTYQGGPLAGQPFLRETWVDDPDKPCTCGYRDAQAALAALAAHDEAQR